MVDYADFSFATCDDMGPQLWIFIYPSYDTDWKSSLSFSSCKGRCVLFFVLGDEIYAFVDGFDTAYTIKQTYSMFWTIAHRSPYLQISIIFSKFS